MTDTARTDPLGALLTAAAPPTLDAECVADVGVALAHEVVESDRERRASALRRRRRRTFAGAAVALAVAVPSGAWAADHFLAQTGRHGDPVANPSLEDASERIDLCAADLAEYVASLAPTDIPPAPGHTWRGYARRVAAASVDPEGCGSAAQGLTQETSLRLDLLAGASADWGCSLAAADRARDGSALAEARRAMLALDSRAHTLSPAEGTTGTWDPDAFLVVSRLPQFTGCRS